MEVPRIVDRRMQRATKGAILIKTGRFTSPAGPEAVAAWNDWGQSGDRKNESCQAGKKPLEERPGESRWAVEGCSVMRIKSKEICHVTASSGRNEKYAQCNILSVLDCAMGLQEEERVFEMDGWNSGWSMRLGKAKIGHQSYNRLKIGITKMKKKKKIQLTICLKQ